MFFFLRHYLRPWWQAAVVIIIALVGYYISSKGVMLPLMFDTAMVALPFFGLGALARGCGWLDPHRGDRLGWLVFVPVAVVVYLLACHIDILMQDYPSVPSLYLIPAVSILALLWMCKNIPHRVPVLCYWGQYSLIVLGTHDLILTPLDHFIDPMGLGLMNATMLKYAITMALELPVIALMIKVAPRFTAQRDFFFPGWKLCSPSATK